MKNWQAAGKVSQLTAYFGKRSAGYRPGPGSANAGGIEVQIDRILNTVLDSEFAPSGFRVAPRQIKYEESADYKMIDQGSTWKLANERLGILYTAKQKPLNDRSKPNAKACRSHLTEAIHRAAGLYGGSVQGAIVSLAEAQTEWIIANLDKNPPRVTTDDEIRKLFPTADDLGMPEEFHSKKIAGVFSSLSRAEKHLTKNQVNVFRREFMSYLNITGPSPVQTQNSSAPALSGHPGRPAWVIACETDSKRSAANAAAQRWRDRGFYADVLWIPDYSSLSGAKLYLTYVGPFDYLEEKTVKNQVKRVQTYFRDAFAIKVDQSGKRRTL